MAHKNAVRPSKETAERAKAEAGMWRKEREKKSREKELGGREGPDPARYGDWENMGIASDF